MILSYSAKTHMKRLTILAGPAVAVVIGCSNNSVPAQIQLPPSLSIASIGVAGTPESSAWTPDNQTSLTLSCDNAPLVVETDPKAADLAKDGFALAVAGNCGTQISCGWLVLRVVTTNGTESEIATASSPITILGISRPGAYTFSLELHDAFDNTLHGTDGKVLGKEEAIELLQPPSCPAANAGDAG